MLIVDRLLIGSIRFVLEKITAAVDAELSDDTKLREELLAAQMKLELGEMTEEEFRDLEAFVLGRLREIRELRGGGAATDLSGVVKGEQRISGVEAELYGDTEEK